MIFTPSPATVTKAATLLRNGGVVAFPTETVYGLGANAYDSSAVLSIFHKKGRPSSNPLIVHIDSVDSIESVCSLEKQPTLQRCIERLTPLWPGPLTLVLPRNPIVAPEVSAGLNTVAVRVPNHPVALQLLKACELPIAAPSANRSTRVSPTQAAHVLTEFGDTLSMILDGGPCQIGLESTVLSLVGSEPQILRPGSVSAEQLSYMLGQRVVSLTKVQIRPSLSPGLDAYHYAPATPVRFLAEVPAENRPAKTGLLLFRPTEYDRRGVFTTRTLSCSGSLLEVARKLFASLRELDELGLDLILVDHCTEEGIGTAIMDRLRRASAIRPRVEELAPWESPTSQDQSDHNLISQD